MGTGVQVTGRPDLPLWHKNRDYPSSLSLGRLMTIPTGLVCVGYKEGELRGALGTALEVWTQMVKIQGHKWFRHQR